MDVSKPFEALQPHHKKMNNKSKTQIITMLLLVFVFGQIVAQTKKLESQTDSILNAPIGLETNKIEIQVNAIQDKQTTVQNSATEFQTDFTSNYIWRDFVYGFVAVQPSVDHTFGETGFSLNVWSSFGVDFNTFNLEVIPSLTYSFTVGEKLDLAVGVLYYTAPLFTTTEVYISGGLSSFPLAPSLEVYYDLDEVFYMSLSLEQTLFSIGENDISVAASVGYRGLSDLENNGIRDLNLGVSIPFELKYMAFTAFSKLTHIPDLDNTQIQGGITVVFK